jgi:hypothetical protein
MPVTRPTQGGVSEISILNRILRPDAPTFSSQGARDILALDFDQADKDRMRELSARARAGTLTRMSRRKRGGMSCSAICSRAPDPLSGHGTHAQGTGVAAGKPCLRV